MKLVDEVNDSINKKTYGCTIVLNKEKNNAYPYVYYIRNLSCNNSVTNDNDKSYRIVKYKINKRGLFVKNKVSKDGYWFKEFYKNLDNLGKHDKKCKKCIKVGDYNKDYYVKIDDIKTFEPLLK